MRYLTWCAAVSAVLLAVLTAPLVPLGRVYGSGAVPRGASYPSGEGASAVWPVKPDVVEQTHWGEPVDGIACRLLINPKSCVGEPVSAVVEIKNVSDRRRYLIHIFDFLYPKIASMKIIAPDGKVLQQAYRAETTPGVRSVLPLESGAVVRADFPDLDLYYYSGAAAPTKDDPAGLGKARPFDAPGRYTFTYTLTAPPIPDKMATGGTRDPTTGQPVTLFHEFPDEVRQAAWSHTITSNAALVEVTPLAKEDLTVHEWGVFSVYADRRLANAERKAEWESLPDFFYRQFPTQRLRWEAMWNKPVIYFHTKRPCLRIGASVAFEEGAPVVWWPACRHPVDAGGPVPLFHRLTWEGWLGRRIVGRQSVFRSPNDASSWIDVTPYEMPAASWLTKARIKDAALLTVTGSNVRRSAPWDTSRRETEGFIFYDGLVLAPDYLRCMAIDQDGAVTLKNTASFPMRPLFVVDRRGATPRFAEAALEAGATTKMTLAPAVERWPATGREAVARALKAAGLLDAETAAMLDIWEPGFFSAPGVTAFYVLPRSEYDRMIPLTVKPTPPEMVRVGVALHPAVEFALTGQERVRALLRELDDEKYDVRERASQALTDIGPPAIPLLREMLASTKSAEVRHRCEEILKHIDAGVYVEGVGK